MIEAFALAFHLARAQQARTDMSAVTVFGLETQALTAPMAPKKINAKKIEDFQFTDVNRALRHTPGVYVREEEGQGLRPNIGFRGTNPDRSKKIVLMEDGVLVSPAPYAAPAAYYTPSMNHVEQIDVLKGFAGLPYGPNSIGGALNFRTPTIPLEQSFSEIRSTYGMFNTVNNRLTHGGRRDWGGYLIQASRLQSDGFKQMDGGGPVGFEQNHLLAKVEVRGPYRQRWLWTGGAANEISRETYLGLTNADFQRNFRRRYAASSEDQMRWFHWRTKLQHTAPLGADTVSETTVYHHSLSRTWYRLDRFADSSVSLRRILNRPESGLNPIYSGILGGTNNSAELSGDAGQLVYANNERNYLSQGVQWNLSSRMEQSYGTHQPQLTLRLHRDWIQRNQSSDRYEMTGGRLRRTGANRQLEDFEQDSALATTVVAQDNLTVGAWTVSPVARWETVRFTFDDRVRGVKASKNDSVFVPGLSLLRKTSDTTSVRTSVHRATTVAGINRLGSEVREEAVTYETEFKWVSPEQRAEASVVGFYNDYQNLTGTCTTSNGCDNSQLDRQFSGGKAKVHGVEAQAGKVWSHSGWQWPLSANVTYLVGTFDNEFLSPTPEWGEGLVRRGDPLPYMPTWQYTVSLGLAKGRWQQELAIIFHDRVFDQAVADDRVELPAWGIVDWAGSVALSRDLRLTARADNLLDRRYAVAARPFGLRPGKPQSFQVGLTWTF